MRTQESGVWPRVVAYSALTSSAARSSGCPSGGERNASATLRYAKWWAAAIELERAHAWAPVGYPRRVPSAIGGMIRIEPWLAMYGDTAAPTPEFPTAALAIARASGAERRAMIDEFAPTFGSERTVAALLERSRDWDRAIAAIATAATN